MSSRDDESDWTRYYVWGFIGFLVFCALMGQFHSPPDIEDDTGICMRPSAQLGC
jgi:hypothetical protein